MTTDRKIQANRANARASTGPKTPQGRARSTRNAFRYGLSVPVCSVPALSQEVEVLAREIAGTDPNLEILELARRIAEAQIDLRRVRSARHQFLVRNLSGPYRDHETNQREKLAFLRTLLRPNAPDISEEVLVNILCPLVEGPQKFAIILSQSARQFLAMDRYERRALSRRNAAILAFDQARRRVAR